MRFTKTLLLLVVLLLGAAATGSTFAQHRGYGGHGGYRGHGWYAGHGYGHVNYGFGVYLGGPWYYPGPYYYAPYYYPPAVAAPSYPTEYVERDSVAAAPQRADPYWYFCPESNTYYPYVNQCAGGWQRVAPRPPAGSGGAAP